VKGFCGWLGRQSTQHAPVEVVARMFRQDSTIDTASGQQWAFGANRNLLDDVDVYHGADGLAVIEGSPASEDSELRSLIQQNGLAKACHVMYRTKGVGFLSRLTGAFSIVIICSGEERVLVARDRIGFKRIYWAVGEHGLGFATNLDQLRDCPTLRLSVDPQAIYDYLYFHVIPSPRTIYKNAHALVPGTYMEYVGGKANTQRFWQVEYGREDSKLGFATLKSEFRQALNRCVGNEVGTRSDVGCFLSGGTDSSTLAGVLGEVTEQPARTYSIGFDQQGFDEMEYARLAARHFGTDHHEYYVTPQDIIDVVPEIAGTYGQPFGNSSVIPTFYCARMAGADGVNKLLGGDGGDELFGGNERYATQVLFSWYENIPESLRKYLLEPLANGFPFGDRIMPVRKVRRYIEQATVPMPDRLQTYGYLNLIGEDAILEREFLESVDAGDSLRSLQEAYADARAQHIVNKMLALDLKLTLADNDLPKVSQMCELAGVSVGYPFLDQLMIDFSSALPANLKVRRLKIRHFFKEALRDFLPNEIITKQKHGFGLPFGDWLVAHKALGDLAFDSLDGLKKRGVVRPDFIDDLRSNKLKEHANYYGGLVWVLMILEQWFHAHDSDSQSAGG